MSDFGMCAVMDCLRPATQKVEHRQRVVCWVCDEHKRGDYEGWTLALKRDTPPALYPPGALQ